MTPDSLTRNGLLPLNIRDLRYAVRGKTLIDGLNLNLETDGITVVMGPNGAGKSLLLRLIHGLLPPQSGDIHWNGVPVSADITRQQSLVFQSPVLLRRSVAANVGFVLRARRTGDARTRDTLLDRVGLADRAGQPARLLSGGEQQRLALARALATGPQVLMLDEATASLDPGSVARIEAIVRDTGRTGTKVIFVTHDIGQARRLADDVVFLHRGQVSEHQSAETFFDHPRTSAARDYLAGRLVL